MIGNLFGAFGNLFGGGSSQPGYDFTGSFENALQHSPEAALKMWNNQQFRSGLLGGGSEGGGMFDFLGGGGNVMEGLGTLGSLYGMYKNLGFMNDQFEFQKGLFDYKKDFAEREYENRRKAYNQQLEDRQRNRLAFANKTDTGNYDSLDKYMSKHGVA